MFNLRNFSGCFKLVMLILKLFFNRFVWIKGSTSEWKYKTESCRGMTKIIICYVWYDVCIHMCSWENKSLIHVLLYVWLWQYKESRMIMRQIMWKAKTGLLFYLWMIILYCSSGWNHHWLVDTNSNSPPAFTRIVIYKYSV